MHTIHSNKRKIKLVTATIALTNKCNYSCKHCSVNSGKKLKNELNLSEIKRLLKKLKNLKVKNVELTGGEPLLKKELLAIIKYAKILNFKVKILTNGSLLTKKRIENLEKAKLDAIALSLDGINYKTYNQLRPITTDTFKKVIKNIKLVANSKIFTKINCVATKFNIKEIPLIVRFCDKNKIPELRICLFTKIGRGINLNEEINPNELINKLKNLKLKFTKVYTGLNYSKFKSKCMLKEEIPLYISANGNIHLCPLLKSQGNIRKDNLRTILNKQIKSCLSRKITTRGLYPVCPLRKFKLERIK